MTRFSAWLIAVACTSVLIHCKTKDKIITSNENSTSFAHWNFDRVQRSMFTISDTVNIFHFPDIGEMAISNTRTDTTESGPHLRYRFIRHISGVATDSIRDTIKSHKKTEETKNSITNTTKPKNNYNSTQYAVFYVSLVLVIIIVFWVKR